MGVLSTMIGGGMQLALGAMNNTWAEQAQATARRENYMYGEMSADNADKRTRALYNDFYSPQALANQYKAAGLSPSMMFGGTPGQGGTSGAQGTGAAGPGSLYTPIGMLEGAQVANLMAQTDKTKAETEEVKAQTKNINSDTDLKEVQKDLMDLEKKLKNRAEKRDYIDYTLATSWIIKEDGTTVSIFEAAQISKTFSEFIDDTRKRCDRTNNEYAKSIKDMISTEQGMKTMRRIYMSAKEFKTDIEVLSTTEVSAKFQREVIAALEKIDYANQNANAVAQQLKTAVATNELTETQKNAWNNLINRLGKDEWYTDVIIAMAMIFGNYANNANIKLNTGDNYVTVNKKD